MFVLYAGGAGGSFEERESVGSLYREKAIRCIHHRKESAELVVMVLTDEVSKIQGSRTVKGLVRHFGPVSLGVRSCTE